MTSWHLFALIVSKDISYDPKLKSENLNVSQLIICARIKVHWIRKCVNELEWMENLGHVLKMFNEVKCLYENSK